MPDENLPVIKRTKFKAPEPVEAGPEIDPAKLPDKAPKGNSLAGFLVVYGVISAGGTLLLASQATREPSVAIGVLVAGFGQSLIFFALAQLLNRK